MPDLLVNLAAAFVAHRTEHTVNAAATLWGVSIHC